jgi:hypothetical protein
MRIFDVNQPSQGPTGPSTATDVNGFAIASLVLGIVWVMGIGSILALVFGYVAKGQIDASGGAQGGRGLAIAGIVLGWVGVGLVLAAIVLMAVGWFAWPWGPMMPMMR